jgi:hypothetical protein
MLRRLALAALLALAPQLAAAQFATIGPTPPVTDNSHRLATTGFVNDFFALGIPLANGKIFVGSAGGLATAQTLSGDCTMAATGVITCTQAAGNFQVIGNLTVGGSIIDGSGILATNIAAPATPSAGTTRIYVDSTSKALTFKNDAGTVGNAVVPSTCSANQFGTSVSAAGVFGCTQPAVSNISGFGTGVATALGAATNVSGGIITPTPTRAGDVVYWNGSAWVTLAGNNSGTQVLQENASGVPSWATVAAGGVTSIAGNTGAFTLGTGLTNSVNVLKTTAVTQVIIQKFTASGTYTPTTGMVYALIECLGGGGGGGGTAGTAGGFTGAGGGGAGSYSRSMASAASVGASKAVTIGAAGSAGAAGNNAGGNGGDTSVGVLCVGKGGTGSAGATTAAVGLGGAGGVAGTGDVTTVGMPGFAASMSASATVSFNGPSGAGASSAFGGGGQAALNAVGNAATGFGAGGGGSQNYNGSANTGGGAGTAGIVVITEFVNI